MGSGSRFFSKGNVFVPGKSDRVSVPVKRLEGGIVEVGQEYHEIGLSSEGSSSGLASRQGCTGLREEWVAGNCRLAEIQFDIKQKADINFSKIRAEISFQPASEMGGVTYAIYKLFSHLVPTPPRRAPSPAKRPWSRLVGVEYIIPVQPGPILSSSEPKATFSALRFHARVLLAFQGWKMGDKLESGWYCQ
ncbi:hypothetical protein HZH66_011070 [Vespula vulgaris]|uniref:Uncharacterized protein n=1 Tax=Vespula vulgaris TaxID=7454 RepID=A0A834JE89_VESVU|nr:hypothetical protein HZH66_011070 [Vespula vulgaris]